MGWGRRKVLFPKSKRKDSRMLGIRMDSLRGSSEEMTWLFLFNVFLFSALFPLYCQSSILYEWKEFQCIQENTLTELATLLVCDYRLCGVRFIFYHITDRASDTIHDIDTGCNQYYSRIVFCQVTVFPETFVLWIMKCFLISWNSSTLHTMFISDLPVSWTIKYLLTYFFVDLYVCRNM